MLILWSNIYSAIKSSRMSTWYKGSSIGSSPKKSGCPLTWFLSKSLMSSSDHIWWGSPSSQSFKSSWDIWRNIFSRKIWQWPNFFKYADVSGPMNPLKEGILIHPQAQVAMSTAQTQNKSHLSSFQCLYFRSERINHLRRGNLLLQLLNRLSLKSSFSKG